MRPVGLALMWIGFVAAAFVTTRQLDAIAWGWYSATAVVALAGIVMLRRSAGAAAADTEIVRANIGVLESSARKIVDRITALNQGRNEINVYEVHSRIDAELSGEFALFADARESMIQAIGLQEYADVMNNFARAERLVNRAWSASADGYIDEVWNCLASAGEAMGEADQLLRKHLSNVGRAGDSPPVSHQ